MNIHYDKAWEVYYELANRRTQPGLTGLQLKAVVDAAVGTFVERAWCATHDSAMFGSGCDWMVGNRHKTCVPEPLPRLVQKGKDE